MEKFVVGCDYDGTLNNLFEYYKEKGEKLFKKQVVDSSQYGLEGMFGISKKESTKFGLKYFINYCKNTPLREGVKDFFNAIDKETEEIHAITARKFVTQNNSVGKFSRNMVTSYAKDNDLGFDSYQYCSEEFTGRDKLLACRKLGVDMMIDDHPEVAYYLATNGIKVALIDTPYNKEIEHPNIKRCLSYKDVSDYKQEIKEIKKQETTEPELNKINNLKINKEMIELGAKRFKLLFPVVRKLSKMKFKTKVIGKENVPYQDGFIVISNHLDSTDQYKLAEALGNRYVFGYMASTIKDTLRGKMFDFTKSAIFMDREDPKSRQSSIKEFNSRIDAGFTGLIFPEGTRKNKDEFGKTQDLLEFKPGAFISAQKTGTGILPCCITNENGKSTVEVGELFYVDKKEVISDVIEENQNKIKKMVLDRKKVN